VLALPESTAEHLAQLSVVVVLSSGPSMVVGIRWTMGSQENGFSARL